MAEVGQTHFAIVHVVIVVVELVPCLLPMEGFGDVTPEGLL